MTRTAIGKKNIVQCKCYSKYSMCYGNKKKQLVLRSKGDWVSYREATGDISANFEEYK